MSATAAARSVRVDEARLRVAIERTLARVEGGSPRITAMRCEPSPFASLFPADVISLSLDDGNERSFFVKHLGSEQADHPEKQCRDREIRIYEELLADRDLPVVRYYGSEWDESTKRRAVFLEYVADWDLRYQALPYWYTVSQQLAALHAHFAARVERLTLCAFLLRFDADYLHEWAERALDIVAGYESDLAAELSDVVRGYGRVADILRRQPLTLVHNDLAPKNVLIDRSRSPTRVAFVDWEMAGIGCGLLDLVDLTYGLDPVSDERMRLAYCGGLAGTGLLPDQDDELDRLFSACRLHKIMHRLAHSTSWRLPSDRVRSWVTEARQLWRLAE
jgi:aminoglycoside phosphotransferase (APT) family kinase protein